MKLKPLALCALLMAAALLIHLWIASLHGLVRAHAAVDDGGSTWSAGSIENALWGGPAWLQAAVPPENAWASRAAFLIWASLFTVTPVLSVMVMAMRGWRDFAGLMALQAVLLFSADVMFTLMPTRPPWMDMDLVRVIAIETGNAVDADANPYAAVPSLHVAVPASYAAWFWWRGGAYMRAAGGALWAWVALMSLVVVYTGEHYAIDVAVGIAWAIGALLLLRWAGVAYARAQNDDAAREDEAAPDEEHAARDDGDAAAREWRRAA